MNGGNERARTNGRIRVERGIYRQQNGKYAVCFVLDGKPRFRTVGYDLDGAREARRAFVEAARWGVLAAAPRLRFAQVASWWLERFRRRVASGERRERTLETHRYHLDQHLLPTLRAMHVREITVHDVCDVLGELREAGLSEHTVAGALATLRCVMHFAERNSWIAESPIDKLEAAERPHPAHKVPRVLGREDIVRLLDASLPGYRPLLATALFTGMRHSELLGLIWDDVSLADGSIFVRAQLSRARRGSPAKRIAPKTRAAIRRIPLAPQLAATLRKHHAASNHKAATDWVFATRNGTPLSQRNVMRSAVAHAWKAAGLDRDGARLRLHDLRHTFASHLIVDLSLDVLQVSRILGHSSASTTLDIYAHLFDEARHAADIRARMASSAFAGLLDSNNGGNVITLPAAARSRTGPASARERAAIRWAT